MFLGDKIKNKLHSYRHYINVWKYRLYSQICKKIGIETNSPRKLIISLTTYPQRFDVVHITIETLLHQTLKPDMIILYLSKEELSDVKIPRHIEKLQDRGVTIKVVDENLKSYNKLVYAIEEYSDYNIVTVDDDILYPVDFLENLYHQHIKYPNEVIAYRCSWMSKKDDFELTPYLSWENANNVLAPSYDLFFTGVGGVLYPPNSLNKEVTNKKLFLKLAPSADDIWFKAMSLLNNKKVMQVTKTFKGFPIINQKSQESALWKINNGLNQNDIQLKNVFDYFELYEYIDRRV